MDIGGVLGVLATVGALVVAANCAGRGAELIGGMFAAPSLGWPHGVQEDDDLSWRWRPAEPDGVPPGPRVAGPSPDPGAAARAVTVERGHAGVRAH